MPLENRFRFSVEKANIGDVPQMQALINHFASKGDMLPRSLPEIYENLRDYFVVRDGDKVIACGALHIVWADLAEIKSLAVAEDRQGNSLGSMIVEACLEEARNLGIPTVFCLTYRPRFFERFGFSQVDIMTLPRKIFGECAHCPKFPACDETAMIRKISPGPLSKNRRAP